MATETPQDPPSTPVTAAATTPTPSAAAPGPAPTATPPATYQGLFKQFHDLLSLSGSMADETSPLKYLFELYRRATGLELGAQAKARTLGVRRPDLADMLLDQANLNRSESTLARTVTILKRRVRDALGVSSNADLAARLAEETAPVGLPFHAPWDRIRTTLDARKVTLWQVLRKTDRDYPSFLAGTSADTDLSRALTLGSWIPPALQTVLVSPTADGAKAIERMTPANGMTLAKLKSVPTFMGVTGLTRRDVRHLLAVTGPGETTRKRSAVRRSAHVTHDVSAASSKAWGATYINGDTPALWLSQNENEPLGSTTIETLTPAHVDRMYRLLQVRHAFGLTIADTDLLLSAIIRATDKSDETSTTSIDLAQQPLLRALGLFGHLSQSVGISVEQFAAIIEKISIYTASNAKPFYDRLFAGTQGTALLIDGSTFMEGTRLNVNAIALLARGLRVDVLTATSLLSMVRQASGESRVTIDLATVSACYRIVTLSRLFGLSPHAGVRLIDLLNQRDEAFYEQLAGVPNIRTGASTDETDILDVVVGFWNAAEWVRANDIEVKDLYLAINDVVPEVPSSTWLKAVDAHASEISATWLTEAELVAMLGAAPKAGSASSTWVTTLAPAMSAKGGAHPKLALLTDTGIRAALETPLANVSTETQDTLIKRIKAVATRRTDLCDLILRDAFGLDDPETAAAVMALGGVDRDAFMSELDVIAATCQGKAIAPTAFTRSDRGRWQTIHRHAYLVARFGLSALGTKAFAEHADWMDVASWVVVDDESCKSSRRLPNLSDAYRMSCYARWVGHLPAGYTEKDALTYLKQAHAGTRPTADDAARRIGALLDWPATEVLTLATSLHPAERERHLRSLADIDLALRMRALHQQLGVSCATLSQLGALGPTSALGTVDAVAAAFAATGTDEARTAATRAHLDHWRNALCRWLLHHWAGKDTDFADIDNRDALSIYFLTDVDVGPEPETTPVAHAIASLQQYIHRLYARLERYFGNIKSFESDRQDWLAWFSQYPLWKLHVQMRRHPEDYLDPTQRTRKTNAFADLEKLVAQGKFSNDDVQVAVLGYLSTFEQLSNIQPISCYEDGTEPLRDTFHFIGCSNVEPIQYYWRTLDMSIRAPDKSPSMLAWSEWEKIDLPVTGVVGKTRLLDDTKDPRTHISTIRPVVISGRRYVVWLERDATPVMSEEIEDRDSSLPPPPENGASSATSTPQKKKRYFVHRLCYAYLQTDGQWSASNTLIALDGLSEDGQPGGTVSPRLIRTLKEIDYQPQLVVMTYQEGDDRAADPWLIAVLFDESNLGAHKDKETLKTEALDAVNLNIKANKGYVAAARDLLLIANRTLKENDELMEHWYQVFRDPRTVQHVYVGIKSTIELKPGEVPTFVLGCDVSCSELENVAEEALFHPIFSAELSGRAANIKCVLASGGARKAPKNRWVANTRTDWLKDYEVCCDGKICRFVGTPGITGATSPLTILISVLHISDDSDRQTFVRVLGALANANISRSGEQSTMHVKNLHKDDVSPILLCLKHALLSVPNQNSIDIKSLYQKSGQELREYVIRSYLFSDSHKVIRKAYAFNDKSISANNFTSITATKDAETAPDSILVVAIDPTGKAYWAELKREMGTLVAPSPLMRRVSLYSERDGRRYDIVKGRRTMVAGVQTTNRYVKGSLPLVDGVTDYPITAEITDDNGRVLATAHATFVWTGTSRQGVELVDDTVPSVELARNKKDVHWITFREANAMSSDVDDKIPSPTLRLNTLFGKDLVARATESTARVLSWETQNLTEPAVGYDEGDACALDLNGANGLYFRELFFHLPWLAAWRLRESRQFRDAQAWCTRWLFDPYPDPEAATPYWKTRPLVENAPILPLDTTLRDALRGAYTDGECYRRAIFHFLVELWRLEGDDHYRQLTRDSLAQAWLCYEKSLNLIGKLPEALAGESWTPVRLRDASADLFHPTPDQAIVTARDLLERRMYNLRHGLTLDGKRAVLPMYAEPPPFEALRGLRTGMASTPNLAGTWEVPNYRYAEVMPRARDAAQRLTDMGRRLFEIYEKEFDAGLAVMLQADAIGLNEYAIALQRNQLEAARATRDKLKSARRQTEKRIERYDGLYNAGLLHNETASITLSLLGQMISGAAEAIGAAEAGVKMVPNIFGMAVGGARPEAPLTQLKMAIKTQGGILQLASEGAAWQAGIDRRYQEWDAERNAATYELETIDEEIRVQSMEIDAAKVSLDESIQRHALMKSEYVFMTTGFAIGPTYIWMISHLSNIYAATYDAVYALCEATNAAFDFETDLRGTRYVWPSAWLDPWRGMLAGEQLERQLLAMDAEYIYRNERRLLVEREISLVALLGKGDNAKGLEALTQSLASSQSVTFDLTHALYDDDYPGHYLRRIKHISVALTFPDDLVPMAGAAAAVLSQTRSVIVAQPDIDAVAWEYKGTEERKSTAPPKALRINILPEQHAAVSATTGNADITTQLSVLGKILFDDDRRLAFEGTGAVSSWELKFTGRSESLLEVLRGPDIVTTTTDGGSTTRQRNTWRLEDIRIRLHYTAMLGPNDFTDAVKKIRDEACKQAVPSQRWSTRVVPIPGSTTTGGGMQPAIAAIKTPEDKKPEKKEDDAVITDPAIPGEGDDTVTPTDQSTGETSKPSRPVDLLPAPTAPATTDARFTRARETVASMYNAWSRLHAEGLDDTARPLWRAREALLDVYEMFDDCDECQYRLDHFLRTSPVVDSYTVTLNDTDRFVFIIDGTHSGGDGVVRLPFSDEVIVDAVTSLIEKHVLYDDSEFVDWMLEFVESYALLDEDAFGGTETPPSKTPPTETPTPEAPAVEPPPPEPPTPTRVRFPTVDRSAVKDSQHIDACIKTLESAYEGWANLYETTDGVATAAIERAKDDVKTNNLRACYSTFRDGDVAHRVGNFFRPRPSITSVQVTSASDVNDRVDYTFRVQGNIPMANGSNKSFDHKAKLEPRYANPDAYCITSHVPWPMERPSGTGPAPTLSTNYPPCTIPAPSNAGAPNDLRADWAREYLGQVFGAGKGVYDKANGDRTAALADAKPLLRKHYPYSGYESVEYRRDLQLIVKSDPEFTSTTLTQDASQNLVFRVKGTSLAPDKVTRVPFDEILTIEATAARTAIRIVGVARPAGAAVTIPPPTEESPASKDPRFAQGKAYLQELYAAGAALYEKYEGDPIAAEAELLCAFGHDMLEAGDGTPSCNRFIKTFFRARPAITACAAVFEGSKSILYTISGTTEARPGAAAYAFSEVINICFFDRGKYVYSIKAIRPANVADIRSEFPPYQHIDLPRPPSPPKDPRYEWVFRYLESVIGTGARLAAQYAGDFNAAKKDALATFTPHCYWHSDRTDTFAKLLLKMSPTFTSCSVALDAQEDFVFTLKGSERLKGGSSRDFTMNVEIGADRGATAIASVF